jgi:O-antigen/teichoic acid export membrane protein
MTTERPGSVDSTGLIAVHTFGLKLAGLVVATIGTVLVSRLLGPEGRGLYYTPVIAAATIVTVAKLGLEQANVFLHGSRSISAERLAAQATLVALVGGGVGVVAMLGIAGLLPQVFGDVPLLLVVLGALTIPISLHSQFISGLQNLVGQVTLQFRAAIVGGVVQLACLLVLWLTRSVTIAWVMGANLLGGVVAWFWTLRTSTVSPITLRWDPALLRETMGHSLVLHTGLVLFFLHLRVDAFMVKGINGATALGIYSLAVVLAETVLLITDSVSIALLPRQVTVALKESAHVALIAARVNAYLALAFAIVVAGTGWALIPLLFGTEFSGVYPALIALLPGIVFISMQRVCGAPVIRAGTPWRVTGIYAGSLAINVGLNLLLIPSLGPVGASLSSSVSYGLAAILFLAWTSNLAGSPSALRPSLSDVQLLAQAAALGSKLVRRAAP